MLDRKNSWHQTAFLPSTLRGRCWNKQSSVSVCCYCVTSMSKFDVNGEVWRQWLAHPKFACTNKIALRCPATLALGSLKHIEFCIFQHFCCTTHTVVVTGTNISEVCPAKRFAFTYHNIGKVCNKSATRLCQRESFLPAPIKFTLPGTNRRVKRLCSSRKLHFFISYCQDRSL